LDKHGINDIKDEHLESTYKNYYTSVIDTNGPKVVEKANSWLSNAVNSKNEEISPFVKDSYLEWKDINQAKPFGESDVEFNTLIVNQDEVEKNENDESIIDDNMASVITTEPVDEMAQVISITLPTTEEPNFEISQLENEFEMGLDLQVENDKNYPEDVSGIAQEIIYTETPQPELKMDFPPRDTSIEEETIDNQEKSMVFDTNEKLKISEVTKEEILEANQPNKERIEVEYQMVNRNLHGETIVIHSEPSVVIDSPKRARVQIVRENQQKVEITRETKPKIQKK